MVCNKCGVDKPENDFYPRNKKCKSCFIAHYRARAAIYRVKNHDKVKEARARYRAANREKIRSKYKDWYTKNGRKRDPLKQAAHSLVFRAIREGRLKRPTECSRCFTTSIWAKLEGHHNDYHKPLEVIWLCNRCHRALHPGS